MPKFIAIAAVTLDGKIAKGPNHFSDWTSKEDKDFLHKMLDKCDCVIVGNNTYKTSRKPLSKRNCIVLTSKVKTFNRVNPKLIYLNPAKIKIDKFIQNISVFAKGFGGLPTKNINEVGRKIAILGGAQTYSYCLQNNLLDELYLTIEPIVFGKGIDLFTSFPPKNLGRTKERFKKFRLVSVKKLNSQGSLLLHYKK